MKKILIILNPAARSAKAKAMHKKVSTLSGQAVIRATKEPGDAQAIARDGVKEGFETIVAAGGDGTINEVVNGIAGSDVRLGVLPAGTMNVFAAELGLPAGSLKRCWEIIEREQTRTVDLAKVNRHYFVQMAGVGLDAQVVEETSWEAKKNFGPLSYIFSAAQIAGRKPPKLRVLPRDAEPVEGSFVLVGNGRFYGGPFAFCREAKIDDGLLDVLVFQNLGYLDIIRYLQGIAFGTHVRMKDVVYLKSHAFRVVCDEPIPVEADGEVVGRVPVTFRISRHKLTVLAPQPKRK